MTSQGGSLKGIAWAPTETQACRSQVYCAVLMSYSSLPFSYPLSVHSSPGLIKDDMPPGHVIETAQMLEGPYILIRIPNEST